jgi:predicted dehydrogenase
MINIGVIGCGYWGKNIVRSFSRNKHTKVVAICDIDSNALQSVHDTYPDAQIFLDYHEMLLSSCIDAVAIVTPAAKQFELAKQFLRMNKHVFVEKPFVSRAEQAKELIELSMKNHLVMMIDYTFLFSNAVRKIKELIEDGTLGELYYFDSMRLNFGPFRHDCNAIWDLASHDFSIMDYLIKEKPIAISASGKSIFGNGLEDVGYITVHFHNRLIAHFNVSWLHPFKIRTTFITGEKKMLVWDDVNREERVKLYERSVSVEEREDVYKHLVGSQSRDIFLLEIEKKEELITEVECFVDCILNGLTPVNNAYTALRIVKMLEATNESLRNQGKIIYL